MKLSEKSCLEQTLNGARTGKQVLGLMRLLEAVPNYKDLLTFLHFSDWSTKWESRKYVLSNNHILLFATHFIENDSALKDSVESCDM